uniref:Uncharacterized protein n=1 Tax=Anguilla anguilla TaxID=7936 RepID=A0A0E9PZT2_ANGAN
MLFNFIGIFYSSHIWLERANPSKYEST